MNVAYLSSEIPSTSATFVYREILEVERQGNTVVPFTLRRARHLAVEAAAGTLATRVMALYERPVHGVLAALSHALFHPVRTFKALCACAADARTLPLRGWPKLAFKFIAGLVLADNLRKHGCEHLHIHFAHAPATVGMYAALAAGIPFSVTAHANDLYENAELLESKLRRAKPFITISEFNRRHLLSLFPWAHVEVVRCGIGAEAVMPEAVSPDKRGLRAFDEPLHIVSVGRLVPKKGFDVLLRALAQLDSWAVPWRCTIAGDGPEAASLHALAHELSLLDGRLNFVGALPPRDVAKRMAGADLFALPCRQDANGDIDGIPVVLMEAMALGVPCLSTRLSGIPELIVDCDTGLLAEPGDFLDLARALRWAAEEPARAGLLARRGREFVWREFSRERNAVCLLSLWSGASGSIRDCGSLDVDRGVIRHDTLQNCHHFARARRSPFVAQNH